MKPFLSISTVLAQIAETDSTLTPDHVEILSVSTDGDVLARVWPRSDHFVMVRADDDSDAAADARRDAWLNSALPAGQDWLVAGAFTVFGIDVVHFASPSSVAEVEAAMTAECGPIAA